MSMTMDDEHAVQHMCCEAPMYMTLQVMNPKKVTRWSSQLPKFMRSSPPHVYAACICILQYFKLQGWCRQIQLHLADN